jgi:hypothetical protein
VADPDGAAVPLAGRKLVELREKLAGIGAEFDRWLESAQPSRPLRKHQSQITRLTLQLRELAARTAQEVDLAVNRDDVLAACREVQLRILEVHRLWDFYRSKLNLRHVDWFRNFLLVADELAWACYKLAQDRADQALLDITAVKEAPLVFFSGEFSPFIHYRQEPFEVEDVPDALDSLEFLQVAYSLPVPVIGLPWYQVAHLPDTVLVAHEVGHAVERDFRLAATTEDHLRAAMAAVPSERRNPWFGWLPEVFADLYGVLAIGPAFVSSLADLLATDPAQVATGAAAAHPAQRHPPASLRIAVCSRALERTGFSQEASAQWAAWTDTFAPDPDEPFTGEVDKVTDGLLSGRYLQFKGRTLPEVVSFSAAQQDAAVTAAGEVLDAVEPTSADIRCLVAAARLAFDDDPACYQTGKPGMKKPPDLILNRAAKVIGDEPREVTGLPRPSPDDDRRGGAALFDLISQVKQDSRSELHQRRET